jgi:3'-phosphoadenosine 5'-phosphosulfate sulfotransferase (PAPS reductase)/FAD synthetase
MLNWEQWKQACLVHSNSMKFQDKIKNASDLCLSVLEQINNPAIAFSGGKDSTVVYHLVKDIAPDIESFYWDDEFILIETELYIDKIGDINIKKNQAKHTDWFKTNIGKIDNLEEFDTIFLGLRADENSYRKKQLANYGLAYFSKKYQYNIINPIGWWKLIDVWAYIFSTNRDYNKAYEIMAKNDIDYKNQRIGPFANDRAIQYGQIAILKQCFPDDYNKFIQKYPIAKSYA